MTQSPFLRGLLLIACLALAVPAAAGSLRPVRQDSVTGPLRVEPFARLWVLLTRGWLKANLGIDPGGQPAAASTGEEALGIDPSGQPSAACTGEAGLGIDPSGQCAGGW